MVWTKDSDGHWFDADYNENTGEFTYNRCVDVASTIEGNLEAQKDDQNGFFKETRLGRHIGEIPFIVWQRDVKPLLDKATLEHNGVLPSLERSKIVRNFLNGHMEYRTVDKILHVDPNPGHVVVK